ncbi:S8 family peptidase [Terrabacter terrigena]|uniref:S8 family serine peptidase n=1 Tax=Terrabacter terrigena TaxID=574718 RepID=A0ABW3MUP7_9MICO
MRPNWRTTLGAATVAVLAATAAAPTSAFGQGTSDRDRPIVGSAAATTSTRPATSSPRTVTLVTGDRVLVTGAGTDSPGVTVLPGDDGSVPLVETRRVGKDVYVYPADAASVIASGSVDEELFNVTGLVTMGYDDASTKTLPVIARYSSAVDVARSAPVTPKGAARVRTLRSVDGVAMKADKARAREFWADATSRSSAAGARLQKLWLDGKVRKSLDQSTKQVNAPQAWALGLTGTGTKVAVLDTGADAQHPDLAGRITGSQDFTDSPGGALSDVDGHGTHTASTVGGSGAASGGARKGVAPDTDLLIGKVLDDYGSGSYSQIVAGMEWAVAQHADVVSMSLGAPGDPGQCDDPIATAAQDLSTSSTSLFVIAAGNSGPGNNTVSTPACAPASLAVGAVDRDDATAYFSSRGPVANTHVLKPEIAAPGVGISAARSGGRGDDAYIGMSGTSMATPHVAGAAAIVKQAHPTWTGAQVKAALVSSADPSIPGDVRQVGAGRLDVLAAVKEPVTSSAVQGGSFAWPHTAAQTTKVDVPYTNLSGTPVTLRLAVTRVTGDDGTAVRSTVATLAATTVTVPAGATRSVPLALTPAAKLGAAQYGDLTGRVVATDATSGSEVVSTPFSLYVAPQTVSLTIKMVDRLGRPAAGASTVDVINTDSPKGERRYNEGQSALTYAVRPGTYLLSGYVQSPDSETSNVLGSIAYFARPQMTISGDTTVTFDATKAHRIDVRTDRPSEARASVLSFTRRWDDFWIHSGSMTGGSGLGALYADVQGTAKDGTWEFGTWSRRYAPAVASMSVTGGPALHPIAPDKTAAGLDGTAGAPVVDAGAGTAADLTAARVKDKVALVRLPSETGNLTSAMTNLVNGSGAKAVLLYRPAEGRWAPSTGFQPVSVAAYSLPMVEGDALKARLAAAPGGEVPLRWTATARSPYVYNLGFTQSTPFTDDKTYVVQDRKLGRTDARYTAMGLDTAFLDHVQADRPDGTSLGVSNFEALPVPGTRTEYYTDGGTQWSQLVISSFPFGEAMLGTKHTYPAGSVRSEAWHGGIVGPTAIQDENGVEQLTAERQGGLMGFAPQMYGDDWGHVAVPGSFGDAGSLELSRDGEVIGRSAWTSGVFEVPAEDSAYALTLRQSKFPSSAPFWKRSTQVTTTWGFRSALEPDVFSRGLPLLFPRVSLPEDGLKTLPAVAGQVLPIRVTGHAGYQPGEVVAAAFAVSYDGGSTWVDVPVTHNDGAWSAVVDHTGAAGRTVATRVSVTDSKGASVTQTVQAAYAVR